MPENRPIVTPTNLYQCPQSPIEGSGDLPSLRCRVVTGLIASTATLILVIVFHATVSAVVTCSVILGTAIALGLMPRGYGKYDWIFGLWIILLGAAFGLTAWCRKLDTINPLDRGHSLLIHGPPSRAPIQASWMGFVSLSFNNSTAPGSPRWSNGLCPTWLTKANCDTRKRLHPLDRKLLDGTKILHSPSRTRRRHCRRS